ncbi:putative zinc metalloproteinase [Aspergillus saccharolyticus JOP 1030-1]|uniref:WLM-domain-containing protein n=1 Tax=Aspergillus saccharolyticus JOP 1030-1 TaxID=1450539 RepID=A0A319A9Y9_9EURO|nr:WLM-domain-containing protein [Aspergillus saccharolyticus JOP 1030-1]PYH48458.1 WLM-domain-containing protein [Aspergillus saccharolyticus JOP 1030-1]
MTEASNPPVEDPHVPDTDTSPAPSESANNPDQLQLTIHHRNKPHTLTLPSTATLHDLTLALETTLNIPTHHQKLLITPPSASLPGTLKPPLPPSHATLSLSTTLPLTSPRFKLTIFGTPSADIQTLNAQGATQSAREQRRRTTHAQYAATATPASVASSLSRIHTLSSPSGTPDAQYTFHRLLPLPHLPNPARSLDFLTRLRDDPGIRSAMRIHKFSVPLLTEMDPIEHTTSHSRTLGLNRNKGEVIELRLRTDAYDGYRDYRTIRKTLCHELAHCVHSDHDRLFWELTSRIEKEVERGDYTRSGRVLGAGAGAGVGMDEFYNPGEWEETLREGEYERGFG